MDRQNIQSEDDMKERQAAALGRLIFEKYYGGAGNEPGVNPAGMNFVYPQGISQGEKSNLDAYIKKLRGESE